MGVEIMNVVPVEFCLELAVGRACEEVQAAVLCQDAVSQLYYRSYRSEYQHVIEAFAVGEVHHKLMGVLYLACVGIYQLDPLLGSLFRRKHLCRARQSRVVDVSNY